jgi:pimeloyl-ACP methyl ester carboxylesterase
MTFEFEGCRFAYRMEGSGPALVMIQGVGAHGLGWNPLVDILRERFTCVTFDNRGIGASQPPARPITVTQMAADVLALMDHVGWRSAHIVGHSVGGMVAIQVGVTARQRVRSLSLLCTFARASAIMRPSLALFWIVLRLTAGTRGMRSEAFMDLVLPPGYAKADADQFAERLHRILGHDITDIPQITRQQVLAMFRYDATPQLSRLSGIPTLVINGEKDMLAPPSSGRAIAAGVAGSRYEEIAGASHAFPVLEPERCSAMVLQHLEKAVDEGGR